MYDTTQAVRFIRTHDSFVILGHKDPDGDCIASQIGLCPARAALGKVATLHSAGPFDRPEITPFASEFSSTVTEERRRRRRQSSSSTVRRLTDGTPGRHGDRASLPRDRSPFFRGAIR